MYLALLLLFGFVYYVMFEHTIQRYYEQVNKNYILAGALFVSFFTNTLSAYFIWGNQTIEDLESRISYTFIVGFLIMALALGVVLNIILDFGLRRLSAEQYQEKVPKSRIFIGNFVLAVLLIMIFGIRYLLSVYKGIPAEQLAFHLQVPIEGTSADTIRIVIQKVLLTPLVILFILNLQFFAITRRRKRFLFKTRRRDIVILPVKVYSKRIIALLLVVMVGYLSFAVKNYDLYNFVANQYLESSLIEEEYRAPDDVALTFPEEKRNLIYIYLESMETVYDEYTPYLYQMAENNISFSNDNDYGGFSEIVGTNWTIASMVAQTSGLPLKFNLESDSYNADKSCFLNGVKTIGEVLKDNGYNNYLFIGSNADFASRRTYFRIHGDYNIYDYYSAIEEGTIPEDYHVWWGYEDKKLYEIAKDKLTQIANEEEPFNFSLLTVDMHPTDGYLDESCTCGHNEHYANVINCADKMVGDFIEWIKQQPFYENTTIVVVGDHLYMESSDFLDAYEQEDRYVYNAIINSAIDVQVNEKNRAFSAVDMFPTTLAALNVQIDGNRLGLGVNLFSDEKTIIERYGLDFVNNELKKKSVFYNGMNLSAD